MNVLVLVSFGLVLLATILLVVGLLADNLTLIYISIASSFTAAVVLYLAFRRARPKADTDLVAPTPIPPEGAEDDFDEPAVTTITPAATTPESVVVAAEEPEAVEPEPQPEPVLAGDPAPSAAGDDWTSDDDWADDGEFDVEFPIADYDDLTVAEIMPLLPQLYSDELGVVAERERTGKNRTAILSRLDELATTGTDADALEGVSAADDADEAFVPAAVPATTPAPEGPRNDALSTPRPAPAAPQVPSLSDDDDDGFVFPIADYDQLSVDQIVPLLAQLEDDELEDVKAREAAGQGRRSVIAEIDRQLGLVDALDTASVPDEGWAEPDPTPAPAPEPTAAPVPEARPQPEPEPAASSVLAIAGYDGLTVAQVRPLLAGLSHDELRAVLDHETARDNRRTIVADIERRLGAAEPAAPAARTAKAPARNATKKAAAKRTTAKQTAKKAARATKKAAAPRFPIADYDTLTVAQIRPQLAGLSEPELRQVQAREESGAGRKTILNEIASRLG